MTLTKPKTNVWGNMECGHHVSNWIQMERSNNPEGPLPPFCERCVIDKHSRTMMARVQQLERLLQKYELAVPEYPTIDVHGEPL